MLPDNTPEVLSKLEVYLFAAAAHLNTFSARFTREYITNHYSYLFVAVILVLVISGMAKLVAGLLTVDNYEKGIYSYTFTTPNYGYMGYALMQSLLGGEMLLNMMIFTLPLTFYTYTESYRLLTAKDKICFKNLMNPVLFCVFIGCIIGLSKVAIPPVANEIVENLSACMAPVSMVLAGSALARCEWKSVLANPKVYIASIIRLVLIPIVVIWCLRLCKIDHDIITVAAFTFCMPAGLNTVVFPGLIGKDCKMGVSLVLISNVMMLVTIPVVLSLV